MMKPMAGQSILLLRTDFDIAVVAVVPISIEELLRVVLLVPVLKKNYNHLHE